MANAQTEKSQAPQVLEADEFTGLLNKEFRPTTDEARDGLQSGNWQ